MTPVVLPDYIPLAAFRDSVSAEQDHFADMFEKKAAISRLRLAIQKLQRNKPEYGILYVFGIKCEKIRLDEIVVEIPDTIRKHIHITRNGLDDFSISYFKAEPEKPIKIDAGSFLCNESTPIEIEIKEGE